MGTGVAVGNSVIGSSIGSVAIIGSYASTAASFISESPPQADRMTAANETRANKMIFFISKFAPFLFVFMW